MYTNVTAKRIETVISEQDLDHLNQARADKKNPGLSVRMDDGTFVTLQVEPNNQHYNDLTNPPETIAGIDPLTLTR